jgi:Zonular occludens toxin (Zot)
VIVAVTGTPGAGKSYMCIRLIAENLSRGKFVATNATLVPGWERKLARRAPWRLLVPGAVKEAEERFRSRSYHTNSLQEVMSIHLGCSICGAERYQPTAAKEQWPKYCAHRGGFKEGRGVAVLDEAHEWLNNRFWGDEDRRQINRWFAEHRKGGWDVYVITQHLDSLDKQVRDRIEYHVVLRNLRRVKIAGIPISPVNLFLAIHLWARGSAGAGARRHVSKRQLFLLDSRRKLYDSFATVHQLEPPIGHSILLPRPQANGAPAAVRPRERAPAAGPEHLSPRAAQSDGDRPVGVVYDVVERRVQTVEEGSRSEATT